MSSVLESEMNSFESNICEEGLLVCKKVFTQTRNSNQDQTRGHNQIKVSFMFIQFVLCCAARECNLT